MAPVIQVWHELEEIICANSQLSKGVPDILAEYGTPSTSVAVLDDGELDAKCYSTIGNDTETVFQACSISKPVAAMAVMKLVSQGRLCLDEPITSYLPPTVLSVISTPETLHLLHHVTTKHLLSHTAGFTVHGFPGYAERNIPEPETILSGRAPSNTPQVRLSGLPGQRYAYSGGGITIIQLIMENVVKKPFADIMHELVFVPLDMRRSFYKTPSSQDNHASSYHTGYQPAEVPFRVHPELQAAGLWTTPTDLLKVVRAVQRSLTATDGSGYLDRDLARNMLDEVDGGMAMGWAAPKDGAEFQHSGSNFGFRCYVFGYANLSHEDVRVPERSGSCVMTNSEEGFGVVRKMMHAIAFAKKWPASSATSMAARAGTPFRAPNTISSDDWMSWQGCWGRDWRIIAEEGLPLIGFQTLPFVRLHPVAAPKTCSGGDSCIDLVLEGLELMVRLRRLDGEKVVEIWDGTNDSISMLRKR